MSEIWFNSERKPLDAPPNAVAWLVRRVVGRGRPQLVYGTDGLPLYVPLAAGLAELRRAVEIEGLYRLHPVDDERRPIEGAPVAYVAPCDMPTEVMPAWDELAALARTSLAVARQILACVPTLLDTAGALLRTSEAADRTITAIRDLMK